MIFTYRFVRRGISYEHHADLLDELISRAVTDIEQDRAEPVEIREGKKVLLGVQEINQRWMERAGLDYWAV